MQARDSQTLDLLVRNGRVIDPATGVDEQLDIGVKYGRIVAIEPDLSAWIRSPVGTYPPDVGTVVIDAAGKIVTPGLIDMHAHVYTGVCPLTVPADETSSRSGVTTIVSAGDAGAHTIEGFRHPRREREQDSCIRIHPHFDDRSSRLARRRSGGPRVPSTSTKPLEQRSRTPTSSSASK